MNQSTCEVDGRLFEYAARIITLVEHLPSTRAGNHVAGQLLRAGTSSLPVPGSIQAAGSKNDVVTVLRTCLKDLQESRRWLRFIKHAALVQPTAQIDPLLAETESLVRIYVASLWVARSKSELRWRLRQPSPRPQSSATSRIWLKAKRAVLHFC